MRTCAKNEHLFKKVPFRDDINLQNIPLSILILGVGGAGSKIIDHLHAISEVPIKTLIIDVDSRSLNNASSSVVFHVKSSYFQEDFGLCGGDPDLTDRYSTAIRNALPEIEPLIESPELCFIVGGMGGNTGTGMIPVISQFLKEKGIIVTALVTYPFSFEKNRLKRAYQGISQLSRAAHTSVILEFDRIRNSFSPNIGRVDHWAYMDRIIALALNNICETSYPDALISYSSEDLRKILEHGGIGTLLFGEHVHQTVSWPGEKGELQQPFIDFNISEIKGMIFHITGGSDICLYEADRLAELILPDCDQHINFVLGMLVKKEMADSIRFVSVVTGLFWHGIE